MPKISAHGGPTHLVGETGPETTDLPPGAIVLPSAAVDPETETVSVSALLGLTGDGDAGHDRELATGGILTSSRAILIGEHDRPAAVGVPPAPDEGGEQPSAGSNTSPSDASTPKPPPMKRTSPRSRARTTENPSSPDPTEGSTAGSMDGDTPKTGTPPTDQPE